MIQRLRQLLGVDAVTEGEFSPFRVHGRTPIAVVSPWSVEQASALLRACSENGWAVELAGGGTWLDWGRPPHRVDVVLSAERLAGVTDYEPADLTISAAAGTPLAELAETVTVDRQMLGLDPPARPGATLGAAIALASAGPLRLSLGTPRDQVLGLELVTGDGRIVRLGGRVVKNVAGYDLVRLVVGSRGTLGLITAAHVRLRPAPETGVTALFAAGDPVQLGALAGRAAHTWPAAMELLAPATAAALGRPRQWALAVRCRGNEGFVKEARRRLQALSPAPPELLDEATASRFWEGLANLEARALIAVRMASLPSHLERLVAMASAAVTPNGDTHDAHGRDAWHIAAHAGNGIVRVWRTEPLTYDATARLTATIDQARHELATHGGTVTTPMPPPAADPGFDPFGEPGPIVDLMRGLKNVFDPAGILSPGRFVV